MCAQARVVKSLGRLEAWLAEGRRHWLALAALLFAVTGLHLFTLMRTPPPFVDEAWLTARVSALIRTGKAFGVLDRGLVDRYEGYWTVYPWLLPRLQAIAARVLGQSLFSMRLVSLIFGLVLLVALYIIGSHIAGRRAGLLAVLLTSLSATFFRSAHLVRYDIFVAALGFTAIALYITDHGPGLTLKSVLSGLAIGIAFEIHQYAVIYGPVIVALHLFDQGWRALRTARFWGFVAGGCIGLAFYAVLHILPYPQTFSAVNALCFGSSRMPPILTWNPLLWLGSLAATCLLILWANGLLALFAPGALAWFLARRSVADRKLLTLFGALTITFAMLNRNKAEHYAILIGPAASLLVAALLVYLWQRCKTAKRITRWLIGAFFVPSTILLLWQTLYLASYDARPEYKAVIERIRQTVPRGDSIMAAQTYWFGMPEEPYYSWELLSQYQHYAPGSGLEDAFQEFRPDYFIMDGHIESFTHIDDRGLEPTTEYLMIRRAELESFLKEHAHLAARLETTAFGDVRIYKIDWD